MDRARKGLLLAISGVFLFLAAAFILYPIAEFYIVSLVTMFIAAVLIGLGSAVAKGFDKSLDVPSADCYYCGGSGRIKGIEGTETCPRCGGTGLARPDD
ncbi:MAG: hypothetical protein JSW61_07905 [Candidatus Thorarchaeota archaeon]|nr:MAG: hypothetical protein JSW61_07905 [Candidatus Thorarchaeota archaeon]